MKKKKTITLLTNEKRLLIQLLNDRIKDKTFYSGYIKRAAQRNKSKVNSVLYNMYRLNLEMLSEATLLMEKINNA
jgi:hypothetical protein